MSEQFTGRWLVSEYVYNPDGRFAGIVQQVRHLQIQDDARIRVIQDCEPSAELAGHPMARFKGHWEFELERDGNRRQYHGPDVIGTGYSWGDKAMTGEGLWTGFGHNFISYGFLPGADRQITGGTFYNAGEIVAKIAGVASPEKSSEIEQYPELAQDSIASGIWSGRVLRYDMSGELIAEIEMQRTYHKQGFSEDYSTGETLSLDQAVAEDSDVLRGAYSGEERNHTIYSKSKIYGCSTERLIYAAEGLAIQEQSIVDSQSGQLIVFRKWHRNQVAQMVDVVWLNQVMSDE